jgi:hypothetical protein
VPQPKGNFFMELRDLPFHGSGWSIFHCFHLELKEVIQRCIPFFSYSIYKILHGLSDNVFRKREPQFEFSKTQKKRNKNGLNLEMLPSPVFIEESDLKPSNATIMMK